MSHTKHINRKISQVDLRRCLVTWLNGCVTKIDKNELVANLKQLKRHLAQMREKGGYVMVSSDGADITIYKIY